MQNLHSFKRFLIIFNLAAGLTGNIRNIFIIYNGRSDCRYIGHVTKISHVHLITYYIFQGNSDSTNTYDILDALIGLVVKMLTFYIPTIATIVVFKLRPDEMFVFKNEEYYHSDDNLYTVALGIKSKRKNTDD